MSWRHQMNTCLGKLMPDLHIEVLDYTGSMAQYDSYPALPNTHIIRTNMRLAYEMHVTHEFVDSAPNAGDLAARDIAVAYIKALENEAARIRQELLMPNHVHCGKCEADKRREKLSKQRLYGSWDV